MTRGSPLQTQVINPAYPRGQRSGRRTGHGRLQQAPAATVPPSSPGLTLLEPCTRGARRRSHRSQAAGAHG
jgi:hypothetical protein